ncbi:MAG: hypothetical protein JWP10_1119 [Nocardioidaceae bacterium]|nr:hypothetical protein [Nocardioidaceae bacterium]
MADRNTEAVLAVNQAMYDAIETGDIDLMNSLWAARSEAICIHPGAEPIRGGSQVSRSWAMLMANVGYIQFFLTDVTVSFLPHAERPQVAYLTCTENMLSGEGVDSVESFTGGKAVASNVFVLEDEHWKLAAHHSSPVAVQEEQ